MNAIKAHVPVSPVEALLVLARWLPSRLRRPVAAGAPAVVLLVRYVVVGLDHPYDSAAVVPADGRAPLVAPPLLTPPPVRPAGGPAPDAGLQVHFVNSRLISRVGRPRGAYAPLVRHCVTTHVRRASERLASRKGTAP